MEHGKDLLTESIHSYDTKLNHLVSMFALEEIRPYFQLLFEFLAQQELGRQVIDNPTDLISIITDFNGHVVERIRTLAVSVMQTFSDQRTALFAVNVIFSQLTTAYQAFLEFHDDLFGKRAASRDQPLPMTTYALEQILHQYNPSVQARQRSSPRTPRQD